MNIPTNKKVIVPPSAEHGGNTNATGPLVSAFRRIRANAPGVPIHFARRQVGQAFPSLPAHGRVRQHPRRASPPAMPAVRQAVLRPCSVPLRPFFLPRLHHPAPPSRAALPSKQGPSRALHALHEPSGCRGTRNAPGDDPSAFCPAGPESPVRLLQSSFPALADCRRCSWAVQGCTWSGPRDALATHLSSCDYERVNVLNNNVLPATQTLIHFPGEGAHCRKRHRDRAAARRTTEQEPRAGKTSSLLGGTVLHFLILGFDLRQDTRSLMNVELRRLLTVILSWGEPVQAGLAGAKAKIQTRFQQVVDLNMNLSLPPPPPPLLI